jgi:predicted nucleic acid-binding Zn ribbon protein
VTTWRPAKPDFNDVDPRPVSESLDRVTRALGAPKARELATLFARWETVVGREIAQHAEPRSLRDGVLILLVDQPAWATQLRYLVPELLARISSGVSLSAVTEIQIRVAFEAGSTGGMARTTRRRDRELAGFDEGPVGRRSHPPLVEWRHRSSGR